MKNDEWIFTKDRLPESSGWVLITIQDDEIPYWTTDVDCYIKDYGCWACNHERAYNIIAWRPLPEPWRPTWAHKG